MSDGTTPVDAFLAASGARLRRRIDEVVAAMLDAMVARVPAYARLTGSERDIMLSGVRGCADLFFQLLAEQRPLAPAELRALAAIGQERAAQGVPLEDLQQAIHVALGAGFRLFVDDVRDHWRSAVDEADLISVLEVHSLRAFDFVHDIQAAMARGYREAERRSLSSTLRAQARLVERVLEGAGDDDPSIVARARAAGIRLAAPCGLVVLIPLGDDGEAVTRGLDALAARFPGAIPGPVSEDVGHGVLLVPADDRDIPADDAVAWEAVTGTVAAVAAECGLLAVAENVDALHRLPQAYRQITQLAAYAPLLARGPRLVNPAELAVLAVFGDAKGEDVLTIVREAVGRVLARGDRSLLDVLEGIAEGRGKKETARRLGLSPGGVYYRLRRIADLTGLDLRDPLHLFRIQVAMTLYRIHADDLPPLGDAAWHRS